MTSSVVVYRATNLVNAKIYIGITSNTLSYRLAKHFNDAKRGSKLKFHRALMKYGKQSFLWEILCLRDSYDEALQTERELIAEYKPQYNMTAGGGGVYGFKFSEESKKKMSASRIGKPSPKCGRKESIETRKKQSDYMKSQPVDPIKVRKMIEGRRKPVVCLNDGMNFISATAAGNHYGVNINKVSAVCRGNRRAIRGFKFRYIEVA